VRRLLEALEDPWLPYPELPPYPLDEDSFPRPPRCPSAHGGSALPLDVINVQPLDTDALCTMAPHLRSILAPILSVQAFEDLLLAGHELPHSVGCSRFSEELVSWGVAKEVPRDSARALMTCFSVPKGCGTKARLILNGSRLNRCMERPPSFSLPSVAQVKSVVFRYGWGQTTDLRHCFYQFALDEEVALFFCLRKRGRRVISFLRMPMGWSWAPYLAQQTALAYLEPCMPHGLAVYDDFLVLGSSKTETGSRTATLQERVTSCKGTLHTTKSMTEPSQCFVFLGVEWDLEHRRLRLSPEFVQKWDSWLRLAELALPLAVRFYWSVVAACWYALRVLEQPGCGFFHLFRWTSSLARQLTAGSLDWGAKVSPPVAARLDLARAVSLVLKNAWVRVPEARAVVPFPLYTDASSSGWAWVLKVGSQLVGRFGLWSSQQHINISELSTLVAAVKELTTRHPGKAWTVLCDNAVVVQQVTRKRSPSFYANALLRTLFSTLRRSSSAIEVQWVSTHDQLADAFTRSPRHAPQGFVFRPVDNFLLHF
jgi:hypothetical protein